MTTKSRTYLINSLYIFLSIIMVQIVDYGYFRFLHNWLKFPDYFPIMYIAIFLTWKYLINRPIEWLIWISPTNTKELKKNLIEWLIYGFWVTIIVLIIILLTSNIKILVNFLYLKSMSYMIFWYLIFIPISAFYEELHYRWLYFAICENRSSKFIISIISSLIFAYVHISFFNDYSTYYLINIFLLSLIFSLLRIRKGNIMVSTWFHISWNLILIIFSPIFNENSEKYAEISHITTIVLIAILSYEIYRSVNLYFLKK